MCSRSEPCLGRRRPRRLPAHRAGRGRERAEDGGLVRRRSSVGANQQGALVRAVVLVVATRAAGFRPSVSSGGAARDRSRTFKQRRGRRVGPGRVARESGHPTKRMNWTAAVTSPCSPPALAAASYADVGIIGYGPSKSHDASVSSRDPAVGVRRGIRAVMDGAVPRCRQRVALQAFQPLVLVGVSAAHVARLRHSPSAPRAN